MFKPLAMATLFVSVAAAAAPPAPFQEAYKEILARSLRVSTQKAEIEVSQAKRLQARGLFLPTVEVDVNHFDGSSAVTLGQPAYSAWLKGSVNLFRAGGDVAAARGADKNLEGQKYRLLTERQGAEDEAVQVLATFIARVLERGIKERSLDVKKDSLRISNERFRRGLMPMQEVDKVAIDVDNARADLTDAVLQESAARAKLVAALGADGVAVDWPWKKRMIEWTPPATEKSPLEARADLRGLESFLAEEKFKQRRAFGALLPSLDLTAKYGYSDLSQTGRTDWGSTLTLSIPLFSGFQDLAGYRSQTAVVQQTQYRLEAMRRQVPAEVDDLRRSFREARDAALEREKTAKLTEKIYADNLQRFRMGRASANDLANDMNRLLQSQVHEVQGWLSAHVIFARLCHALGSYVSADGQCQAEPQDL